MDKEKDVQGVVAFLEFTKPGATTQVMIVPDGYAESGNFVPGAFWSRVVTEYRPKAQWRNKKLRGRDRMRERVNNGTMITNDEVEDYAKYRLQDVQYYVDRLSNDGWTLVGKPIYVEASKKDLTDVSQGKTPAKVVYRINQSKKALGFPESK